MALKLQLQLCVIGPDFLRNFFFPKHWEKWAKNGPKSGIFQFLGRFDHYFLLNSIINLYYLLCSCTNLIFEKVFILEIWAKMFSANQIAGFFN